MSSSLEPGPVRYRLLGLHLVVPLVAAAACAGPQAARGQARSSARPQARAGSGANKVAGAPHPRHEDPALAGFRARAEAMGVIYTPPPGYAATPVIDDHDVSYDYAVLSKDKRVEIRFALRPYTHETPPLVRTAKGAWAFFMTAIMNVTHLGQTGQATAPRTLPATTYAADVAKIVLVTWTARTHDPTFFGSGYKFGVAVFLHRDHVGDAYEFFLLRDRDAAARLSEPLLHSLRFAQKH